MQTFADSSDWSNVFLQRFAGVITLTPRSTIRDWFHLLDDPDRPQLKRMIEVGQRVTWPAMRMIHNRTMIERAIFRGRTECRQAVQRDRPTTDRAEPFLLNLPVPIESDADSAIALRYKQKREVGLEMAMRRRKGMRLRNGANGNKDEAPPSPSSRSSITDTIRNMRSSSMSAFGSLRTPRSASRMSVSRWFGGSDSESDNEDDELAFLRNGDQPPADTFDTASDQDQDPDPYTSPPDTADEERFVDEGLGPNTQS